MCPLSRAVQKMELCGLSGHVSGGRSQSPSVEFEFTRFHMSTCFLCTFHSVSVCYCKCGAGVKSRSTEQRLAVETARLALAKG